MAGVTLASHNLTPIGRETAERKCSPEGDGEMLTSPLKLKREFVLVMAAAGLAMVSPT